MKVYVLIYKKSIMSVGFEYVGTMLLQKYTVMKRFYLLPK